MSLTMFRIGLRQCPGSTILKAPTQPSVSSFAPIRSISYITKTSTTAFTRPKSTSSSTISLSQIFRSNHRNASTLRQAPQKPASTALNWNTFFQLRKSRRRYSLISSLVGAGGTGFAAFYYLSRHPEAADALTSVLPDPIIALGASLIASILLGWLIGPIFGNSTWNLVHRSSRPEFALKEKTFFERIRKHRVNPMGATANNPVPDFYGEKISSVSGYRQWLKDQRVFNKKREGTYTGPYYPSLKRAH